MNGDLEAIRDEYRPASGVRVLLIGESPPRGWGFFYTANSSLSRCTVPVLVKERGFPEEPAAFLRRFAEAGFFLDDFSSKRGDKPASRAEDADVREAVARIAKAISVDGPAVIVGVLRSLERLVAEAVELSAHPGTRWECLCSFESCDPRPSRLSGGLATDPHRAAAR